MSRIHKQIQLLALGVALTGIWAPQVWAQSEQPAADDDLGSNAIIVTARRVEETVQDVPMTVNVITDEKLKDLNLFNGSDLAAVVPGLVFAPSGGQSTPVLSLRGAARGAVAGRVDPTVQTYLNEAPVTDVMVYQALYDIGQIEVLRGPQGTLRGRPSAAGAITFTTKRPDLDRITGYVSTSASNHGQLRGEGAVSVPLLKDILAVRVAGIFDHNDNDGVRSVTAKRDPYQKLTSWRASMRFKPAEILEINLMYQDFKSVRASYLQEFGSGYVGPKLPQGFNGPTISPFDRLSVSSSFAVRDEHHKNFIAQAALDLGEHHRLSYIGLWNKTTNINYGGLNTVNFYPINYPDPQLRSLVGHTKLNTHEIRFESTGNSFWDYGIGGYYEKNTSDNLVESIASMLKGTFGNPFAPSLGAFNYNYSLILSGNFPTNWKNQAIYANSTFHITPDTDLFAGVRRVWYEQSSDQIGKLSAGKQATGLPLSYCDGIQGNNPGSIDLAAIGGFASPHLVGTCDVGFGASTLFASNPLVTKEKAWVYNASLTHRFTEDLTAYLSYGHSWRPSTNNLNLTSFRSEVKALARTSSETSNSFEAGVKVQMLDRKLTANFAIFYQKYKGFLYSSENVTYLNDTVTPNVRNTAAIMVYNADAKVRGFDLELAYRPSRQFSISGNVNYAKGRLSNALVPCNDSNNDGKRDTGETAVADLQANALHYCTEGGAMAFQADWNASLQAEYNMPVSDHTDAYIRTLVSYTPKNKFAPGSFTADAYALINLYLGMRGNDGQWDVGAYARNLTNATKVISQGGGLLSVPADAATQLGLGTFATTGATSGYRIATLTPRREFGATFRFNW